MVSITERETEYPVQYQAQLRRLLVQRFSLDELRTLAFDLGMDLDDLPGEGRPAKTRELVAVVNRAGRLGELAAQAERERPEVTWPSPMPLGKENPYKGLSAFHEEDAHLFFGRETVVTRLAKVINKQSLMAVVDPSGSGKSSVVFAGLLPKLREDEKWLIVDFRPGTHPILALASSLLPLLDEDLTPVDRLIESKKLATALGEGELSLSELTEQILKQHPGKRRLLLIIDQFEELYTLARDEGEAVRFLEVLIEAQISEHEDHKPYVVLR